MFRSVGFTNKLTIKQRQMLIIISVSITVLLIAAAAFFINDYRSLRQNMLESLTNKAVLIGANSAPALVFDDKRAAHQALEVAAVDETILLAVLYDIEGRVFAQYAHDPLALAAPAEFPQVGIEFGAKIASIMQPINSEGQPRGWLYVVQDCSALAQKRQRYLGIVLAVLGLGILIAWLMSSLTQRILTDPIINLAKFVERITQNKDYSERMTFDRQDEIGVLVKGVNNMLSVISDRERELQQYGERLEGLVRLRTRQLHRRANYDALTQLPNRYLLMEKLNQAMESARRTRRYMALLLIDLDRFKVINDSLGHHFGDELLQALAKRLAKIGRVDDCVARLGGDEFVIMLGNISYPEDAGLVARKIIDELSAPVVLQQHRLHVSASIGISVFPKDANDAMGLLRRADISMYRSKANGKGAYMYYESSMESSDIRLILENRLRHALKNDELYMVYQPQLNLQTQQVSGVEALMRWRSPELGDVYPAEFIPVALEIGLIHDLTRYAIDEACRQYCVWQKQAFAPPKVAINVSASDLLITDFVEYVRETLAKHAMQPCCLELEITEDVFLDRTEQITAALRELKSIGVAVSIDDFGTGYSSLSYLRDFPVDVLKLDGSFVQSIQDSDKSRGIVASAVSLAHGLGLSIVAECVETEHQYSYLLSLGCDVIQGYHFSKPLHGDELPGFMRQQQAYRLQKKLVSV